MRNFSLTSSSSTEHPLRVRLSWFIPFGIRWILGFSVAFIVIFWWIIAAIHPSQADTQHIVQYLILSSIVGIAIGAAAMWWVHITQKQALWLKLSLPAALAIFIIGLNVTIIAHLMFISVTDAQLVYAFLAFGMIVAAILSLSLASTLSKSMQVVITGAQRIADGDYSYRIASHPPASVSEMQQLAHAFDQMAMSIANAFALQHATETSRKTVLAALSHDVRTPLASIRAMLEAIDDGVVSDAQVIKRYHTAMRAEIGHLSVLLDDLFEISRIEAGAIQLEIASMDIGDVISDVLAASHEAAERKGIVLEGLVPEGIPAVLADTRQVYRIIMNLTQNAIRHTPSGGLVHICASISFPALEGSFQPNMLHVRVLDTGEGIAPHDLPHIFMMAYRGEASRQRNAPPEQSSAGLGLAIARGLVEAMKGQISAVSPLPANSTSSLPLHNITGPGSLFEFTLPIMS